MSLQSCVVKRGFAGCLQENLEPNVKKKLTDFIDISSELTGRLTRRASLIFLYYITSVLGEGNNIPDLESKSQSYFVTWLQIGLRCFGSPMPDDPDLLQCYNELQAFHNIEDESGHPWGIVIPTGYARIITYAAEQWRSSLINHYKVHLFQTMKRACRLMAGNGVTTTNLYMEILKGPANNIEASEGQLMFIGLLRNAFNCGSSEFTEETYFSIPVRANVMWLLQTTFASLGARKIQMSPIFAVQRPHVRLDLATLADLAARFNTKGTYKSISTWKVQNKKSEISDPEIALRSKLQITAKPKKLPGASKAQWEEITSAYKAEAERIDALRREERNTTKFKAQMESYKQARNSIVSQAMSFFKPFEDKKTTSGWIASPSINTDGISLSIEYTKNVKVRKITKKRRKTTEECCDYDPLEDTTTNDSIIIGVDPGRTSLVAAAWVVGDKTKTSKFTRSQYYQEGGIKKNNAVIKEWDKPMKGEFNRLRETVGTKKSHNWHEIYKYIEWNSSVETKWFDLRLQRKYNRQKFGMYIKKREALDQYASTLKKQVQAMAPNKTVKVAYGACGPTMRSNGKGELSVPTTGIYNSFKRVFGQRNVFLTDEFKTTKVSWETGKDKEAAYCIPTFSFDQLESHLFHTKSEYMPTVKQKDMPAYWLWSKWKHRKKNARLGGKLEKEMPAIPERPRFVEVRGLCFCPKSGLFVDRDYTAARAIAGIGRLLLLGKGRPSPFCRKKKSQESPLEMSLAIGVAFQAESVISTG